MNFEIIHTLICAGCLLVLAAVTYRIRPGILAAMQLRTKVRRRTHGNEQIRTK